MDAKRFLRLKEEAEALKAKESRIQGSIEEVLTSLKEEYGVGDKAAAEKLLKKLDAEADKLEAEYEKALTEYEKKWISRLSESD
jgi:predicted transcriptional regulator